MSIDYIYKSIAFDGTGVLQRDSDLFADLASSPMGAGRIDGSEMVRVKIFSSHHALPETPVTATKIFEPILTNIPMELADGIVTDKSGSNIAGKATFGSVRQHYFVWKNLAPKLDYVGFEQYRRVFFIDPLPSDVLEKEFPTLLGLRQKILRSATDGLVQESVGPELFAAYMNMRASWTDDVVKRVKSWIDGFDIIYPRPYRPSTIESIGKNIETQWKVCHRPEVWDPFVLILKRTTYFRTHKLLIDFDMECFPVHNMYIMRRDFFYEYMGIWQECFFELEGLFPNAEPRMWEWLSERLFALFCAQKRLEMPLLRTCELPVLFNG